MWQGLILISFFSIVSLSACSYKSSAKPMQPADTAQTYCAVVQEKLEFWDFGDNGFRNNGMITFGDAIQPNAASKHGY